MNQDNNNVINFQNQFNNEPVYAKFDNSEFVTFKHFYKAIANCQSVYSDVVKKEIVAFKEQFKDFLEKENVDLNDY